MRKKVGIVGVTVVLIVAGLIYYLFYALTAPQEVALDTMQQVYSGKPQDMTVALENVDFSTDPKAKQQMVYDLTHNPVFTRSVLELSPTQVSGEISEIVDRRDDGKYRYVMVDLTINQAVYPHLFRLHKVDGDWKLDIKSMCALISRIHPTYKSAAKQERKRKPTQDIGYGLGDAFELTDVKQVEVGLEPHLFDELK